MKASAAPFRPAFGATPPVLAGRSVMISRFADALETGPGSAARAVLFTGSRGIGKTVALNEVEAEAKERGWLVLNDTVSGGLLERFLTEHIPAAWHQAATTRPPTPADPATRPRLSGIKLPGGVGLDLDTAEPPAPRGLRANLTLLADAMAERGSGVMVSLDEVHRSNAVGSDLAVIAATIQHLVREDREIAFAGAGLPAAVQDVLTDDVVTFLRRSTRFDLRPLTAYETGRALREPIEQAGRSIGQRALDRAVEASQGYPYLVQIIGQYAWEAEPRSPVITLDHVAGALPHAIRDLGTNVHQVALNDLSDRDRDYLRAMLHDEGASEVSDILERLGVNHSYASRYRHRLIVAGMIQPAGRGRVAYALPYLRDYLAENEI